jgi:hypothetical protein
LSSIPYVDRSHDVVMVGEGQLITIRVHFSAPITVDTANGTPYLLMRTAPQARVARFAAQSATGDRLDFVYDVREGDTAARLDVLSEHQGFLDDTYLWLNGSAILNTSLVLPPGNSSGSLSTQIPYIAVDTSPPTIVRVYVADARRTLLAPGDSVEIFVEYNRAVSVIGRPTLKLAVGDEGGCKAEYHSGSGSERLVFIFTAKVAQGTADLDHVGSIELNGGSIKRYTTAPRTAANLTLPAPGLPGSLGFNNEIVIDPTAPTLLRIDSNADGRPLSPFYDVLDVYCGNRSVTYARSTSFRLAWNGIITRCLTPCGNLTSGILQEALHDALIGCVDRIVVKEVSGIQGGSEFRIRIVGSDVAAGGGLAVVSCTASPGRDLPKLNLRQTKRGRSAVVSFKTVFSAPVVALGRSTPYLDIKRGRRAYLVPASRVQYVNVDWSGNDSMVQGEFQLRYGHFITGCIGWNVSDAQQDNALLNQLLRIDAIKNAGGVTVSGSRSSESYRFSITFASERPLALEVISPTSNPLAPCQPLRPRGVQVSIPENPELIFQYTMPQNDRLILTVKPNETISGQKGINITVPRSEGLRWAASRQQLAGDDLDVTIAVESRGMAFLDATTSLKAPPTFVSSSLSFTSKPMIGNVTGLSLAVQLNANLTPGDILNVTLTGFSSRSPVLALGGQHAFAFQAVWDSAASILMLTCRRSVLAYEVVAVTISGSVAFVLPEAGIFRNMEALSLSYFGGAGTVPPGPFTYIEPVGVAEASVSYDPPVAGSIGKASTDGMCISDDAMGPLLFSLSSRCL